jgi:hypothetical protein
MLKPEYLEKFYGSMVIIEIALPGKSTIQNSSLPNQLFQPNQPNQLSSQYAKLIFFHSLKRSYYDVHKLIVFICGFYY